MSKYVHLQVFCKLQKPLANYRAALHGGGQGFESPRLHSENCSLQENMAHYNATQYLRRTVVQ